MCKISVIMPAYNAAQYIERAIQSVIRQTVDGWELIVVNDASTDHTAEIVRRMAAEDTRITLYENKSNLGVSETRNRGIELAAGEYIAFLDSDDIWKHNKLQCQVEALQRSNADLCFTAYAVTRENGEQVACYRVPQMIDYIGLLKENVIGCSTVLLKRSSLGEQRFESGFFHEDYVLWLNLLKNKCVAVGIDDLLVWYRTGGRSQNKINAAKNRWKIYRKHEQLPLCKAAYYFSLYCCNGIRKHLGIRVIL